jgi:deoxycytidine triphosphate deaminase
MSEDLPEEFIAENDLVLKFARQGLVIGVPGILDPGFAHETESCLM